MKKNLLLVFLTAIAFSAGSDAAPAKVESRPTDDKLRVIMSSDFPPIGVVKGGNVPNTMKSDPDDMQSMVRFLLYSNEFDVEGLIASAGTFAMEAHKKNILGVLDQYEKVYENLKTHDPDYPTADYLRSVTFEGKGNNHGINMKWGRNKQPYTDIIGKGMDSEASNAIIAAADKPDPRPLWIGVWGGPREVAQAIWDVKNTRSEEELKAFISKLRVFLIAYQDATNGWLMEEFPDLFIIDSRKTYQGMFGGHDPISNLAWVNENVRNNHGPLCDVYPHEGMGCTGVCEGDSPTFLYLVSANRGINNPEDPTQPSWGGQYKRKANTNHYVDGPGASSISRWRKDYQKEFAERADWCVETPPTKLKPRVVVLTDISTWETDDHESLIRFLAHADMFEIEALILSTGYSIDTLNDSTKGGFINLIHGAIDAYEKDLPNLMKRSNQIGYEFDDAKQEIGYWPSAQYLRDRTMTGSRNRGKHFIGDDNDSPGSNLIIKLADENDDRHIWVTVWGGGNTVAQSIYRVKKDRTAEEFKSFLCKIRVYTITDQDRTYTGKEPLSYSSHGWMRSKAGSDLLFIWDECAWKAHDGTGKSDWDQYEAHIQDHGNLGSQYPKYKYGVEGDTPSFLFVMPTGLNNPEDPSQCSWGGTFSGDANNLWRESNSCRSFFDRFYPAAFNNFAARMDWAKDGAGNRNPVIVLDGDDGISILMKIPKQGTTVTLDASKTFDPDGDNLKFNWWIQSDAGTCTQDVKISNSNSSIVTVNVPSDAAGESFHAICEVIDDGTHNLSDYRRIIFEPVQ